MFCPACGQNIPVGSRVCYACGKKVTVEQLARSKESSAWPGLLIAILFFFAAWFFIESQRNPKIPKPTSDYSVSELQRNIGRTAYNARNKLKIGVVTGVIPKVVGNRTTYVYGIKGEERVWQFAPEAVRLE
jgi:hypothetical protein